MVVFSDRVEAVSPLGCPLIFFFFFFCCQKKKKEGHAYLLYRKAFSIKQSQTVTRIYIHRIIAPALALVETDYTMPNDPASCHILSQSIGGLKRLYNI